MIAVTARSRALPLVAGGTAAGLALAVLLAANRGVSSSVVWFVMALALALLTGIAKTTTV